jgi:hypothetical protein
MFAIQIADARQVTFNYMAFHGAQSGLVLREHTMTKSKHRGQMTFMTS